MYREYETKGTINGKILTYEQMKKLKTPYNRKPMFHEAEEHLYVEFCEHRKVGDKVSGLWLRARMEQLAKEHATTPTKKALALSFKASYSWLSRFARDYKVSYRKKTNKKSQSAIKRSKKVRRFHWYAIYKARLLPSKRSPKYED